jgi:hypothetical protein
MVRWMAIDQSRAMSGGAARPALMAGVMLMGMTGHQALSSTVAG